MKRKSHVTAISLPGEVNELLNRLQHRLHKNRSELIREMIDHFVDSTKKTSPDDKGGIDDSDANKILRLYHQLLSQSRPKPTLVVVIGIVNKKDQVIIGRRKPQDRYVKDLHWTFPSGTATTLDFENQVSKTVKKEVGLDVRVIRLIHARLIPDSPTKRVRIIGLYYHCRPMSGKPKAWGDFDQVKWVPADQVNRHFTTSVSDEVMNFLGTL